MERKIKKEKYQSRTIKKKKNNSFSPLPLLSLCHVLPTSYFFVQKKKERRRVGRKKEEKENRGKKKKKAAGECQTKIKKCQTLPENKKNASNVVKLFSSFF